MQRFFRLTHHGGTARLLERNKAIEDLTDEDLAYIGYFAATSASLSTEHSAGIPGIRKKM